MKDALALQFYYTSCRHGLSGYAGFQTRTETLGLHLDERRELESKALYQPPRDLPSEPDAVTIAGQFPKAFRVAYLSSGRMAIIRAAYSGQDYSGRWGNYFAHGLVLDGPIENWWPIDSYAWSGWVGNMEDGADVAEPEPLPAVLQSELTTNTDFAFEELQTFLGEGQERPDVLARMLCAVFRRATDSRSIVIRERLELDAVYWIACIQKSFPPSCQRELTFSTFQFDPRSSLAINATIGETDFLFDEGERKYQFYVFDFVTGQHSDVSVENAEYAEAVAAWMASDPQRLKRFHEFAALFDYNDIGRELLYLLRLYQLECGEQVSLTTQDRCAILEFVSVRAESAAFRRVLQIMGNTARDLSSVPLEGWVPVIRFLAEGAASTGDAEHRRRACQAWIDAFDHFVIEKQMRMGEILTLRDEIERKLGCEHGDLAQIFLSDAHLDWLWEHVGCLPVSNLGLVMSEVERSCRQLGREPTYQAQEVQTLIEVVLYCKLGQPLDFRWALAPFRSQVEGLSSIVAHMISVLEVQIQEGKTPSEVWGPVSCAVGRSLAAVLSTAGDRLRFNLLNHLKDDERYEELLFREWEETIRKETNKTESHACYERNVLADDSKFSLKSRDKMATALLDLLPPEHQRREARNWVESGRCRRLSNEVAGKVLALASLDIKLTPEDQTSQHLAEKILLELNERQLHLDLRRLKIRAAACRALSNPKEINDLYDIARMADDASYRELVDIVLPRILANTDTPDGHRKVVLSMAVDTHLRYFIAAYNNFLKQRPKDCFDEVDIATLLFWLRLNESDSTWPVVGCIKEPAIEAMAIRIGSMNKKNRIKVETTLKELSRPRKEKLRLESFLDRASKLQPSWLDRLLCRRKKIELEAPYNGKR